MILKAFLRCSYVHNIRQLVCKTKSHNSCRDSLIEPKCKVSVKMFSMFPIMDIYHHMFYPAQLIDITALYLHAYVHGYCIKKSKCFTILLFQKANNKPEVFKQATAKVGNEIIMSALLKLVADVCECVPRYHLDHLLAAGRKSWNKIL